MERMAINIPYKYLLFTGVQRHSNFGCVDNNLSNNCLTFILLLLKILYAKVYKINERINIDENH